MTLNKLFMLCLCFIACLLRAEVYLFLRLYKPANTLGLSNLFFVTYCKSFAKLDPCNG